MKVSVLLIVLSTIFCYISAQTVQGTFGAAISLTANADMQVNFLLGVGPTVHIRVDSACQIVVNQIVSFTSLPTNTFTTLSVEPRLVTRSSALMARARSCRPVCKPAHCPRFNQYVFVTYSQNIPLPSIYADIQLVGGAQGGGGASSSGRTVLSFNDGLVLAVTSTTQAALTAQSYTSVDSTGCSCSHPDAQSYRAYGLWFNFNLNTTSSFSADINKTYHAQTLAQLGVTDETQLQLGYWDSSSNQWVFPLTSALTRKQRSLLAPRLTFRLGECMPKELSAAVTLLRRPSSLRSQLS